MSHWKEEETMAQMAESDKTGIPIHYTRSSHSVLDCHWSHQNPELNSELTGSAGQHEHPLGCYLDGSTCTVVLLGSVSLIFTVGQINSEGSPVILCTAIVQLANLSNFLYHSILQTSWQTLDCSPCFAQLLGSRDVYHSQVGLAPSGNCRLILLLVVVYSQREADVVSTPFLHILMRSQLKFAKCFWLRGHQLSAGGWKQEACGFYFSVSTPLFSTPLWPCFPFHSSLIFSATHREYAFTWHKECFQIVLCFWHRNHRIKIF